MGIRLEAALDGDLTKFLKREQDAITAASNRSLDSISLGLRNALRSETESAGLGKLSKSWKRKLYLKDDAAQVYTDSPKPIGAFDKGGVFVSPSGFWLAIPTDAAPKRGNNGKRISPSNFPEERLGKLHFVYRSNRLALLVVENLRARQGKRGGFGKASATSLRTGRGLTTVIMFILVPRINIRKRLNVSATMQSWGDRLASEFIQEVNREVEHG